MSHNPLDQFKVIKLFNINLAGFDISFTNSSLYMSIAAIFILGYFLLAFNTKKLIPTRLQVSGELIYTFILDNVQQNIGPKGLKYAPLIFALFMFILICNLLGMLPYSFTVTSHISITFILALLVFFVVTIIGFVKHGVYFLSLFLPKGTPTWLAPLMIVVELFAYLARPISLALRLAANMVAGHVLLKVMAGFVISLTIYLKILPIPLMVILIGFEIFIAILQAYIFSILSCVYLNDAINLH